MLIDIGVNLSNSRFKNQVESVLVRAKDAGVEKMILTGTSISDSEAVTSMCEQFEDQFPYALYATAGVHPHETNTFNNDAISQLNKLCKKESVVAVGETGLDFNRNFSDPKSQERAFESHIEIALDHNLPLFLHERDAAARQLEIIRSHINTLPKAVIHCFTGDRKTLFSYLDLDLYIGITGWICDERRGLSLQSLVKNIPLDRLMIETDAPYLLPRTMPNPPKNRCNEPSFLPYVIKEIANHREETIETLKASTSATALNFFNL
jgi:TatD DNase family protein